ncbi:MAG: hypothetical protein U0746_14555 [Gemmataceae bacterium]
MPRTVVLSAILAAIVGCAQTASPPTKSTSDQTAAAKPVAAPPAESVPLADSPKPAPPAPKYSLGHYERLKIGMTADEIKAVVGEPTDKTDMASWSYVEPAGTTFRSIVVQFDGGKAISKAANGFVEIDPKKLTKANVAIVKIGMSEKEIVTLLGPGDPAESIDGSALSYLLGEKALLIVFVDGKVSQEPKPVGFDS